MILLMENFDYLEILKKNTIGPLFFFNELLILD